MSVFGTHFIYKNQDSRDHGLILCAIGTETNASNSMGLEYEIMNDSLPDSTTLDYGIKYSDQLSFPMTVTLASGEYISRNKKREIVKWLTDNKELGWLQIFDGTEDDIHYLCRVTSLTEHKVDGQVIALNITWTCSSAFGWSPLIERTYTVDKDTLELDFYCDTDETTFPVCPKLTITANSDTLSIKNDNDNGRTFKISGLDSGDVLTVDNINKIILINNEAKTMGDNFNFKWIRFWHGTNHLTITGNCEIKLTTRFPRKAGEF